MSDSQAVHIFTDGGCHGNPGPGGWAFIVEREGTRHTAHGGAPATTNNRMELEAVIHALEYAAEHGLCTTSVHIHTDSQYVRNGITTWIINWERNGWKTSAKKPVKNRELWMKLREAEKRCPVEWHWVRGHSGHPQNEEADALVQEAIAAVSC